MTVWDVYSEDTLLDKKLYKKKRAKNQLLIRIKVI